MLDLPAGVEDGQFDEGVVESEARRPDHSVAATSEPSAKVTVEPGVPVARGRNVIPVGVPAVGWTR